MAFGNISTLYLPTAANAGASQWGTDVRKLLDSADAGSDATTKMNHGTGGTAVVRTSDPYSTSAADLDQSLYGWAITPADMNSVSGARRFMHAGNHVATVRVGHTALVAKNANFALYIYRVGNAAGGRVRTLLGTANSGTVSIPGTAGELTVVITVALGEIIFDPDETIQYVFESGAAGTTVTGDTITLFTGTQSSVVGKIDIPKLGVLADTTGAASGSGSAAASSALVLGTQGASAGSSSVEGAASSTASTTGVASGSATPAGVMSSVAGTTGSSSGSSSAAAPVTGIGSMIGASVGSSGVDGRLGAIGSMEGSAAGSSSVSGNLSSVGSMEGSASGSSSADGLTTSLAGTTGSASGSSSADGLTSKVLGTVGSVDVSQGGETVINISQTIVFDD